MSRDIVQCGKYPEEKCDRFETRNFEECDRCVHNLYSDIRAWNCMKDYFKKAIPHPHATSPTHIIKRKDFEKSIRAYIRNFDSNEIDAAGKEMITIVNDVIIQEIEIAVSNLKIGRNSNT